MEEIQEKKRDLRDSIAKNIGTLSEGEVADKIKKIENRLFDFANFVEAKIPLLYVNHGSEVVTWGIINQCFKYNKVVVLPVFGKEKYNVKMLKVDDLDADMKPGPKGIPEPDDSKCQTVPIHCIDIALIPSVALDEKGGRLGSGDGHYDRLIPKLPITARKVSIALESQIVQQIPMASHDKYVDIIITDERVIYKI
ncbi:MAG: 5-formyltetrahydrofolate cyclo-ligase [Desulfobacteraceae bacterium]|nr:5-formyltetrahydrofolate cyclo-ligase [Desulfobacteraceae bacterium]